MQERLHKMQERASFYDSPAWGRLLNTKRKQFQKNFVDNAKENYQQTKKVQATINNAKQKHKRFLFAEKFQLYRDEKKLFDAKLIELRAKQKVWLT